MGSKHRLFYVIAAIAIIAIAIWAYTHFAGPVQTGRTPLTPEAKAYVRNLKLGPVEMKATDSYVHQTITEIKGTITNSGDRALRSVYIYCVFYDAYGQIVLRELEAIVKPSAGGSFKPGDTRHYRLAFDDIPGSWNNQLPQLVIAQITFD